MDFAYSPSAHAPPETAPEREAIGRIAAGIWAAIAFFGALATVRPLRFPEMDVSATRTVVLSATVIAAITFILPWKRLPRASLNVLLVLMAGYITALAHVSGAVGSSFMMLVTFGIALAVCFLPVKTSVVEVALIAVLLGAALVLLDKDNAGADALRISLLLAVLVVLGGLVLILRTVIAEREEAVGPRLFDGGVLEARGFDKMLDRELSRAIRHKRPLSVVQFEVSGLPASKGNDRVLETVSQTILERLRVEDSAGHLSGLRFAVIAPETPAAGAVSIAENVTEVLRTEVTALGYDRSQFDVAAGWADYPHHADSRAGLLSQAQNNLEAAAVRNQLRPSPAHPDASPAARPAPAGPDQH